MKKQLIIVLAYCILIGEFAFSQTVVKKSEIQKSQSDRICLTQGIVIGTNSTSCVATSTLFETMEDVRRYLSECDTLQITNGVTVSVCVGVIRPQRPTTSYTFLYRDFTYSSDGRLENVSKIYFVPYH